MQFISRLRSGGRERNVDVALPGVFDADAVGYGRRCHGRVIRPMFGQTRLIESGEIDRDEMLLGGLAALHFHFVDDPLLDLRSGRFVALSFNRARNIKIQS